MRLVRIVAPLDCRVSTVEQQVAQALRLWVLAELLPRASQKAIVYVILRGQFDRLFRTIVLRGCVGAHRGIIVAAATSRVDQRRRIARYECLQVLNGLRVMGQTAVPAYVTVEEGRIGTVVIRLVALELDQAV